jgi:hypothetical protein
MPDRHGELADVRPIYRPGDHVLVCLPNGLYRMEIRASEVIDGEVWFYGRRGHLIGPFTAACVVCRLTPDEIRAWP